jgi:hypothetical protein
MPPAGFESAILASERPQCHDSDLAAEQKYSGYKTCVFSFGFDDEN